MLANGDHKVFHCRWNWCARTFQFPTDLLGHLKSEHFSHILRVEKKELDIYLRSNEGRSGMTDSLLQAIPTQSTETSQGLPHDVPQMNIAPELSRQEHHAQTPRILTQPSPTRNTTSQERRTAPQSSQSPSAPGPSNAPPPRETSGQTNSQHSASPPEARISPPHHGSRSFADCAADSSPITTPQASPLPPTPPLHSRIADAINAAATARPPPLPLPRRAPARLPISPAPRGHSPLVRPPSTPRTPFGSQPPMTPLPLPRRAGRAAPPASQPHGASAFGHTQARVGGANVSTDSAASARDVERQLVEGATSATPSPAVSRVDEPPEETREPPDEMREPQEEMREPQEEVREPQEEVREPPEDVRPDASQMDVETAAEVIARMPSLSYPDDPYPPLQTQAAYDSQGTRADERPAVDAPSSSQQTHARIQSPASQASFTSQFSSGRLALRMDSEPPEGDAMDVDFGLSAPLQLQTQAPYPSQ